MATSKILVERRKVNEGLVQDVKDIKEMLVSMQRLEAARVERENHMREDVEKLKKTVDGNGNGVGLKTDVELLKVNDKKRTSNQNTIIVAIIIQIIMLIVTKLL